ncbi:MAG: tetratricopeptide repeat protein [Candidatus Omnitrophota bacterium]
MGKKIFFVISIIVISVSSVVTANFSVLTYKKTSALSLVSNKEIREPIKPIEPKWTLSEYRQAHVRAAAYIRLGQNSAAIDSYKKILSVNPYDSEAYKMLAYISAQDATESKDMAKLSDALEYMEKAFDLDPSEMGKKDESFLENLQKQLGKEDRE